MPRPAHHQRGGSWVLGVPAKVPRVHVLLHTYARVRTHTLAPSGEVKVTNAVSLRGSKRRGTEGRWIRVFFLCGLAAHVSPSALVGWPRALATTPACKPKRPPGT